MRIYWKYGPAQSSIDVPIGSRIQFHLDRAIVIMPNCEYIEIPAGLITHISTI